MEKQEDKPYQSEIVWKNVVFMGALHFASLLAVLFLPKAHYKTVLWGKCDTILFFMN